MYIPRKISRVRPWTHHVHLAGWWLGTFKAYKLYHNIAIDSEMGDTLEWHTVGELAEMNAV